jgi:hypothetical protein
MSKSQTPDPSTKGKNDPRWWFHPTHRYAPYLYVGIVFAVVVAYYLITIAIVTWWASDGSTLNPGTFGDTFGAINALFTGVAFAGFLISLALQRQEMAYQQKQLEYQREDLQNQTKQLELQTAQLADQKEEMKRTREEMELQRNESNLFSLIDAHKRFIDSLRFSPDLLSSVESVMGDLYFLSYRDQIHKLTGTELLKYMVDTCFRYDKYRSDALVSNHVRHLSYLLGGSNDLARICRISTGIEASTNFLRNFVKERMPSEYEFYEKIFLNSISMDELALLNWPNSSEGDVELPRVRLELQGVRWGRQPRPAEDGYLIVKLKDDAAFVKDSESTYQIETEEGCHPFEEWGAIEFDGTTTLKIPLYPKALLEKLINEHQSNLDFIWFGLGTTIRIQYQDSVFEVPINWRMRVFEKIGSGIELLMEGDKIG